MMLWWPRAVLEIWETTQVQSGPEWEPRFTRNYHTLAHNTIIATQYYRCLLWVNYNQDPRSSSSYITVCIRTKQYLLC